MSYRAFKRLLGETSLERKCRFLFGTGIFVLIFISFWFYALQTEGLAYDQATTSCRLLVNPSLLKKHLESETFKEMGGDKLANALNKSDADKEIFGKGGEYQYEVLKKNHPDLKPFERELIRQFERREHLKDEFKRDVSANPPELVYYGAVRASKDCLQCHSTLSKPIEGSSLSEEDLLGVVRIRMKTEAITSAVHVNRAYLITTALVTALLFMTGSWLIVRYVIVKPLKHLKDVSDAISAGELNVRSEIQTGDEFEDLSHAFNRMLRNLVSMQDRLRRVNADLDRKVDELAQANMALYESNRLKGDFLATISHELRTPLNSILGFSEVLASQQLNDRQQRWVGNIQTSGDKLLNLINDILDLAKIEAGKMEIKLEEFSIQDICEGVLNMFRPLAEKKNLDLGCRVASNVPLLRQDPLKIQQILQNVVSNAVKFTPARGRVMLEARVDGKTLLLSVTDTGVGIAADEREHIFEKFRQAEIPLTREYAGTGLGLSIVRELAKLLGGDVELESEMGRGSTFTVRLPLHLGGAANVLIDVAGADIDLSKAQRVDVHPSFGPVTSGPITKLDRKSATRVDVSERKKESA